MKSDRQENKDALAIRNEARKGNTTESMSEKQIGENHK